MLDLAPGIRIGAGSRLFSPASLFAASEPGAWYDPSDLTTLFQTSAGNTPVTAAGQSVGLMLDKSQGLVLGPELVTNGDFSNGTTGWTATSTSIAVVGGRLQITGATQPSYVRQSCVVTAGKWYEIQYTAEINDSEAATDVIRVSLNNSAFAGSSLNVTPASGLVTRREKFLAAATSTNIEIIIYGGASTVAYIDNISLKLLPGNHAYQSNSAQRPTYQVENGLGFLLFDGSDDGMLTGTITPGTDKAQVFAGVRKLSDAALGMLLESSTNSGSNNGALQVRAPASNGGNSYLFASRGTTEVSVSASGYTAPITNVITGIGDISGDVSRLRVNGTQVSNSAADQGAGNYLAYPLYIGRRGGSSLPFNGRIYSLIVRFGANLTADQIAQAETWMNQRTGAY